jgi:hypothetical protein
VTVRVEHQLEPPERVGLLGDDVGGGVGPWVEPDAAGTDDEFLDAEGVVAGTGVVLRVEPGVAVLVAVEQQWDVAVVDVQ